MKKPIAAIIYDFDKTICTRDMQEYGFIPELGLTADEFWEKTAEETKKNAMDGILAYMRMMLKLAGEKGVAITREKFVSLGKGVEFYPGVEDWFERVNEYGKRFGVTVEHYVISSGLHEIIEGSPIYRHFKKVYACEYLYDVNGVAVWPKVTINYTNKTQFLFRINKGVLEVNEDKALNNYTPEEERRVPFRNMIYIGDGLTDVPCMKLVRLNGGQSVAVFKKRKKETALKLLEAERVDYITEANYEKGSELDDIVRTAIEKISGEEKLARLHRTHLKYLKKS